MRRNKLTDIDGQVFTPAQPKCHTRPGFLPFCPGTLRVSHINMQAMLTYCMHAHSNGHIPRRRRHLPDLPMHAVRIQVDAKKKPRAKPGL
jgi:hypothetical protein